MTTCTTKDCQAEAVYRSAGLCRACYRKAWRAKKPKKGKTPANYPDVLRFEKRITPGLNGCWEWVGSRGGSARTYGVLNIAGRQRMYAHRWSYEYHRAPIPDGLEIDHLCHNTLCVNPWHLEPVTRQVNAARVRSLARTHCPRGHEFTPENTYHRPDRPGASRDCKTCRAERQREAAPRRSAKARATAAARTWPDFCKHGHSLGDDAGVRTGPIHCPECKAKAARAAAVARKRNNKARRNAA